MSETNWVNKHPFQPSKDFPDYCMCGAHIAHPEHEVTAQVDRAQKDIAYLRRQVASRCLEIARAVRDQQGQGHKGWLAAKDICNAIAREFGLLEK